MSVSVRRGYLSGLCRRLVLILVKAHCAHVQMQTCLSVLESVSQAGFVEIVSLRTSRRHFASNMASSNCRQQLFIMLERLVLRYAILYFNLVRSGLAPFYVG